MFQRKKRYDEAGDFHLKQINQLHKKYGYKSRRSAKRGLKLQARLIQAERIIIQAEMTVILISIYLQEIYLNTKLAQWVN
ncbi:hypothetical protein C5471_21010 [Photorhabdus tasmaniensis]|uniref:Transposase n=1 Tax=Photorhabdus tasmaniensis TaxID=1004159 RepID=A0ABX0GMH9_9GAMM|nr:hypothetical protein [Photorhabdus tasmaniensis]